MDVRLRANLPYAARADMLDPKQLEDLAAKLGAVLPAGLRGLRGELEDNFRAVLRAHLERLDLVSRERFDVQADLLSRTQARLAALEARLLTLEGTTPQAPGAQLGEGDLKPKPASTQAGEGEA